MKSLTPVFLGCVLMAAHAAQLPFAETFEAADGVTAGTLDGQNGWVLDGGSATVQSSVVQSGLQALQVQDGRVSRDVLSEGSAMWLHFQARFDGAPDSDPVVPESTTLAFFVNTNMKLVVYSNAIPVELDVSVPIHQWIRFDVYCDYDDAYWDLGMDGVNVAAGLPLYSTEAKAGSMTLGRAGSSPAYIDRISIANTEQTADGLPDSDGDTIPDWWEQKHFGGISSVAADGISGNDGLSYLQAYIAGVSPHTYDPFAVSPVPDGKGLSWHPVPSRRYSVYWTTNLVEGFSLLQADLAYPQAEFLDLVHGGNTNVNGNYEERQAAGLVVAPYSVHPQNYRTVGDKLQQNCFAKWLRLNANLASHIVGRDFELAFKVSQMETRADAWSSIYMNDADDLAGDARDNSNLGMLVWGEAHSVVYSLYHGVGAQANITQGMLDAVFGSFDRSQEHAIQFISWENGGSRTYDFVVDGITITNLPYAFSEDTLRQIETVGVMEDGSPFGGVFYDDLAVRLPSPSATVFFDSFDNAADSGFYHLKVEVE